jgi:hypothetical protein
MRRLVSLVLLLGLLAHSLGSGQWGVGSGAPLLPTPYSLLPSLAWGANTHATPDPHRELQAWFGDAASPYLVSGCQPSVPGGLTLAAFACAATVRGAAADLVYVSQASAQLGPLSGGNGTYWLALHRDTSTSVSGWTRQSGTHYLWKLSSTPPTTPSAALVFAQVTVSGGAITAVQPLGARGALGAELGAVVVMRYATGGDGTSSNPWTGWDTAITWASNTTYLFPSGTYSYSTCPAWGVDNIRLLGMGPNVVLKHTGTGNAVCIDGGASSTDATHVLMENFAIQGNSNSTNALYIRAVNRSTFRNLTILGASTSGAGVQCEWCVLNTFEDVRVAVNDANVYSAGAGFYSRPDFGLRLTRRGSGENSTANTFRNFVAEGLTAGNGQGIRLLYADSNHFFGGASESNIAGVYCLGGASGTCLGNSFRGMFFEANTSIHASITSGEKLTFTDCYFLGTPSSGAFLLDGTGEVRIQGGQILGDISIPSGSSNVSLEGVDFRGTLTDASLSTTRCSVRDGSGSNDYPVCHFSRNTNGANGHHLVLRGQGGSSAGATARYGLNTFASTAVAYIDAFAANGSTPIVLQLTPGGGGIAVGTSGATISSILEGSNTALDVGSIANGAQSAINVTVTGAALKDYALCSASVDLGAVAMTAKVTAANTAQILLVNNSGGAVDPPSADYRCLVIHRP